MSRRSLIRLPALIVLLVLTCAAMPAAASAAAPSWSLPVPTAIQSPFTTQTALDALDCADASACFAGSVGAASSGSASAYAAGSASASASASASGEIYTSPDLGTSWAVAGPADRDGGGPFACSPDTDLTTPFCVAITPAGSVERLSVNGAALTGPASPDALLETAAALACPSSQLCVAAGSNGADGEISYSTAPLTGNWTSADVDAGNRLTAISCPDLGLCVAIDSGGDAVVSSDPTAGNWTVTQVATGLDQVSCPSDQLCVAVASSGQAYVSMDPAGGQWTQAAVPGAGDLTGVSCPSPAFCAISDANGGIYTSTDPAGASFSQVVNLSAGLGQIDCLDDTACLVLDGADVLADSSDLADASDWQSTAVDAWTPLVAVSCPSAALCVALQQDGRADSSTTPLTETSPWQVSAGDSGQTPVALDCPRVTGCYGVDATGGLIVSTDPSAGVWKRVTLDRKGRPVSLSCASETFCAMVDSAGYVFTSTDPGGGASHWTSLRLLRPFTLRKQVVTLTAVTCPTSHFCLITDGDGQIFTSTDPHAAQPGWKRTQIWNTRNQGDYSLTAASCPTATDCVVMATDDGWLTPAQRDPDALGTYALTSSAPNGAATTWRIRQIDGGYVNPEAGTSDAGLATGLSCPTTDLCAMVDNLGTADTNTGSAAGAWLSASIDAQAAPQVANGQPGLTGISCFKGGHCVAVDGFGNRFAFGVRDGPVLPSYAIRFSY